MKTKKYSTDIKSKSLNETKSEISDILERLENNQVDLEASKKDYEKDLLLNDHVDSLFKEKLNNIKSIELKNKNRYNVGDRLKKFKNNR